MDGDGRAERVGVRASRLARAMSGVDNDRMPSMGTDHVPDHLPRQAGDQQDTPVSMTSGAGSLWVLDLSGPLLRIDPASGAVTRHLPVRGLGADVASGDGFIWVITEEPNAGGGQDYLSKAGQSRHVTVKAAPIPAPELACAGFPGPQGTWIGCAGVDRITLIDRRSLKPTQSLRVGSGRYTPRIVPGPPAGWVLTPSGLARADPAR
jgi:hypothetical protein